MFFCSFDIIMTKLLSIYFASLIFFQSFNLSFEDFSRLSALVEHVSYHQKTYGDSFIDFLSEHYGNSASSHNDEHQEHKDLPFKDHHQTCHTHINFTLQVLCFSLDYEPFIEIPFNFYYSESSSLFEKPSFFQPPKLA